MMLCGLTGGVGMGKSTAAGYFSSLGARVVDTDEIARALVQPGQPALAEIQGEFGQAILAPGGGLDRAVLARLVFNDEAALRRLEGILHPRIRQCWQSRVAQWRAENCPLAVVVIPLLFETQAENLFDKIVCVACTPAAQRDRLQVRGWTGPQIRQRNAAQWPVAQKIARSHIVLWAEGALENTAAQVARVYGRIGDGGNFPGAGLDA